MWNDPYIVHYQNCVWRSRPQPRWPPWFNIGLWEIHLKILFKSTEPIATKANFGGMLLNWSSTKIVYGKHATNQHGGHSETLYNIGTYGKFTGKSSCLKLLSQLQQKFGGMGLHGPLQNCVPPTNMAVTADLSLTLDPTGNSVIFMSEASVPIANKL